MFTPSVIDLHTHSTCSDGTYSPSELVSLAKRIGLSAIALTDHDTLDGLAEFCAAGTACGIETICGIEFASLWENYHRPEIHIVGLGFDPTHPAFAARMQEIRQSRINRNRKMCEKLTAIGLPISLEEVSANAGGEIITRAHFANVLLQKGFIRKREDAFSRYIAPGLPAYVEREFLSPACCIRTIKEAGGVAILAHPTLYGLSLSQIEELCLSWKPYGLDGIECQYSTYTPAQTAEITALAERVGLLPSGGSDFHGENKPQIHLGSGKQNLSVPYAFWDALKKRTTPV